MNRPPLSLRTARAIYRMLLRLYPPPFRRDYGAEMARTFADLSRDAHAEAGLRGVASTLLRGAGDTLSNSAAEWLSLLTAHWGKTLMFASGCVALCVAWQFLFVFVAAFTEIFLVPWDTAGTPPPLGTLARTVNDFFEAPPGALLPSWLTLAGSMWLLLRALRSGRTLAWQPWRFALLAFGYVAMGMLVMAVGIGLNNLILPFPPNGDDPGFHRAVIPCIMQAGLAMAAVRLARTGTVHRHTVSLV